ncbi:hypothetical protein ACFL5O_09395 [Myxococcota bacterium]
MWVPQLAGTHSADSPGLVLPAAGTAEVPPATGVLAGVVSSVPPAPEAILERPPVLVDRTGEEAVSRDAGDWATVLGAAGVVPPLDGLAVPPDGLAVPPLDGLAAPLGAVEPVVGAAVLPPRGVAASVAAWATPTSSLSAPPAAVPEALALGVASVTPPLPSRFGLLARPPALPSGRVAVAEPLPPPALEVVAS